jgi:energy-coupling factor transporter ATP-binding protein EcfA2
MEWRELHWPRPLSREHGLSFLTTLAADTARDPLVFEIRTEAGKTRYLLGGSEVALSMTASLLRRLIPGAESTGLSAERTDIERAGRVHVRQRNLNLSLEGLPETLRSLLAAMAGATGTGDVTVLQLVLGRAIPPELFPANAPDPTVGWIDKLIAAPRPAPSEIRTRLQSKLGQYRFRAAIRLGVTSPSALRRQHLVFALMAALRTLQSGGTQIALSHKNPQYLESGHVPLRLPQRLTPAETLALLAWPVGGDELPGVQPVHPHRLAPPAGYTAPKERVFAVTTAPGVEKDVGITIDDALRHSHVVGPTGAGKSTLLQHLIAADIRAGRSVVVIDPKRDLAMDVLGLVPREREGEVVVLDPTLPLPVGLNPFRNAGADAPLIADRVLAIFRGLFPSSFGPLTSDTLHASLLTLAAVEGSTLAQLPELLTNPAFRRPLVAHIADPALASFWAQYEAKSAGQQAQADGPVMTRLRQFILRPGVRAVLDQPAPRFELGDLFTKPRILVASLNKGILGPKASELLGSLLVSQLFQLILARAAVPPAERTPLSIYVDEAQSVLHIDDLGEALEQSRSLGAAWHLAHQHRGQLPDKLLRTIDANARSKILFSLEDDEARAAARLTGLDAEDFTRLPPHEIYASLQNGGQRTGWFSARVLAPPKAISSPDRIIAESQARYGALPEARESQDAESTAAADDESFGRVNRGQK